MPTHKDSPFRLNRTRIFLLAMGALVVLIAVSMAMGGLSSYHALKEAATAARTATDAPAEAATGAASDPLGQ